MKTEVLEKVKSLTNSLKGSKQTEVGLIPEDWELVELGNLFANNLIMELIHLQD